ncbi:hypothetical protein IGI04_040825 [Brassica rapa subsp. trilocularis]|uniref:Uncharacterized protein n=1 Tax=Brassica rapa subsp. trilocularis TaxID=1813537 RepID=A0ABQ7KSF6_BRACM|nr:hypothetical protein IGI04_040825 [Brassica rapa subsp. trilocularis]
MAEHCMVIPGAWASVGSLWEFVIDKKNMSWIVPLRSSMSLRELQNNMAKEFFTFTLHWTNDTTGYTDKRRRRFLLFQHFSTNSSMNLFITFDTFAMTIVSVYTAGRHNPVMHHNPVIVHVVVYMTGLCATSLNAEMAVYMYTLFKNAGA